MCKESGALPVIRHFMVVPANVYDSLVAGSDKLDVNVEEWNATAVPSEHTAGYPICTVKDGTGTGEIDTTSGGVLVAAIASGAITAAAVATGAIDADALAADAVDEILDEVIEGAVTLRQAIRLLLSAMTAKCSGGGTTTITFRDIGDTKDRLIMTVDASGNRSAVGTRDGS